MTSLSFYASAGKVKDKKDRKSEENKEVHEKLCTELKASGHACYVQRRKNSCRKPYKNKTANIHNGVGIDKYEVCFVDKDRGKYDDVSEQVDDTAEADAFCSEKNAKISSAGLSSYISCKVNTGKGKCGGKQLKEFSGKKRKWKKVRACLEFR